MYAICRVEETGQTWTEEDDFQVLKPSLDIEVSSSGDLELLESYYCCDGEVSGTSLARQGN